MAFLSNIRKVGGPFWAKHCVLYERQELICRLAEGRPAWTADSGANSADTRVQYLNTPEGTINLPGV